MGNIFQSYNKFGVRSIEIDQIKMKIFLGLSAIFLLISTAFCKHIDLTTRDIAKPFEDEVCLAEFLFCEKNPCEIPGKIELTCSSIKVRGDIGMDLEKFCSSPRSEERTWYGEHEGQTKLWHHYYRAGFKCDVSPDLL